MSLQEVLEVTTKKRRNTKIWLGLPSVVRTYRWQPPIFFTPPVRVAWRLRHQDSQKILTHRSFHDQFPTLVRKETRLAILSGCALCWCHGVVQVILASSKYFKHPVANDQFPIILFTIIHCTCRSSTRLSVTPETRRHSIYCTARGPYVSKHEIRPSCAGMIPQKTHEKRPIKSPN